MVYFWEWLIIGARGCENCKAIGFAKANQKALIRGTWGLSVDLQEIPQGTGSGFLWDKESNFFSEEFFSTTSPQIPFGYPHGTVIFIHVTCSSIFTGRMNDLIWIFGVRLAFLDFFWTNPASSCHARSILSQTTTSSRRGTVQWFQQCKTIQDFG